MKQPAFTKSAVLAGSALFAGLAFSGEPSPKCAITPSADLGVGFGVGYTNEYVFRGENRGDDLFEASIGVSGSGSLLGLGDLDLSAGLWLGTYTDPGQSQTSARSLHEMRINMEASKSLGSFDLAVGVTNYSYFGNTAQADNLEPYVALGTELAGLSVGIGLYDTEDADEPYRQITVGRTVDLGDLSLSVDGVIGTLNEFDDTFYGISVGLPIAASDNITVTPHVSAIFGDTTSGDDEFTAGVNLDFGF